MGDVHAFLTVCKESGNQAYEQFKGLLKKLEDPNTRKDARRFLSAVEKQAKEDVGEAGMMDHYHFRIHQLTLSVLKEVDGQEEQQVYQTLTLLEMSSIFVPEAWSFTFYEGLTRHPETGFRDRELTELGCGNGWISIAMAERWCVKKVYGLDINPRAIKVAWINLYLNALTPDGAPVVDREGKTLLDRVEFYESDLLAYIRDSGKKLDRVVGCIPQVLSPDPETTLNLVSEAMSEEFLHSLSNYCGLQGFVEDQFGLGLIARAVEEAIEVVKPNGAIILNMGGRPGQAVCQRLFERRGFNIKKLWQTRVNQAADTDILALVEIEKNSRHRFEFFMGPVSEEPICARTAYAFAKAGGIISHGLTVYECRLQQPNHVKTIFKFLKHAGYEETRSALDLSFTSGTVADEKVAFLAHLARVLQANLYFPSEPPAGNESFRKQIADFLRLYFRVPFSLQNVIIVPSRAAAIENLLRLYSPHLAMVDTAFTRWLPKAWLSSLPSEKELAALQAGTWKPKASDGGQGVPVVLEAPRRTDLVLRLAEALQPRVMVLTLADFEMRTSTAFAQLLEVSERVGARLFLDISDYLELSSLPGTNGVLQYLAEHALPPHAAIVCGLVKNQVYSDLEVCFVLSENEELLNAVTSAGELTYSRTACVNQMYYGCLLHELLSFQIPVSHTLEKRPHEEDGGARDGSSATKFLGLTASASAAFDHPVFRNSRLPGAGGGNAVRMDVGENRLPSPAAVQQFVFEGFARQNISEAEMDPRPEILQLLEKRFSVRAGEATEVVLGDGTSALFSRLMFACVQERGTVILPSGGVYGTTAAVTRFAGVEMRVVPTEAAQSFKLHKAKLAEALGGAEKPWVLLTAPLVNPTGCLYSGEELGELLSACREHGARVVLDTSYSGLEYGGSSTPPVDLGEAMVAGEGVTPGFAVAILGEFSKQFSAGGLRFGYAAFTGAVFGDAFKDPAVGSRPHGTLRYAVKKILGLLNQEAFPLLDDLSVQKRTLEKRAQQLVEVLSQSGWEPLRPQGGLFLVARPAGYEGRTLKYSLPSDGPSSDQGAPDEKEVRLDSTSIVEALFATTGLLISGSEAIGLPGYCRFVVSLEEDKFAAGLSCIRRFHSFVIGGGGGSGGRA